MEGSSNLSSIVPSTTPLSSLYFYNYPHQFPGTNDQKRYDELMSMVDTQPAALVYLPPGLPADHNIVVGSAGGCSGNTNQEMKKKRLTRAQLEFLERSFQEDVKLDPDRKMKLSRELGLEPRQIAVWFQNRRARWKNKHLEHLYESLRQEFDVVSREKELLQEEVTKLKTILQERRLGRKRTAAADTEVPTEDTDAGQGPLVVGCSSGPSQNPYDSRYRGIILEGEDHNHSPRFPYY